MSTKQPRSLNVVERNKDGSVVNIPVTQQAIVILVKPGGQYALIDMATGKSPANIQVKRKGNSLVIEDRDSSEVLVEFNDFYDQPEAAFAPQAELTGSALDATVLTAESPVVHTTAGGEQVIWMNSGNEGLLAPVNVAWGLLGAGGLVVAASGGGGGGADGGAVVSNTVAGTIVAGPVVAGNDLRVEVFQADGITKLGEALVNADGSFSLSVGSYMGVVIARVVNRGGNADYLDEATQSGKNLNANLFGIEAVTEPNSTVTININVMTTLAYLKAIEAAGGSAPSAALVASITQAIADLFGLPGLHGVAVVPINGGAYDSSNGLSAGEAYGAILAALSGTDALNGGDSQKSINDLLAGLSVVGGSATLTEAAQGQIVKGAEHTSQQTGQDIGGIVAGVVDSYAPNFNADTASQVVDENIGAAQVVYTAAASDASGAVGYSLKTGLDAALFSIDAATGAVTLTGNPDHEAKAGYSFTVVATDAAGNAGEQTVTLAINDLDEIAPAVSSVAISSADGIVSGRLNAGDVVRVTVDMTEATFVNTAGGAPRVALNIGGSTVYATYFSGSGTAALVFQYTIQAGEADVNGISIAANALQPNGGTLKDAAGNDAVLTHALVADNASYLVDTAAPTLASSTPADNATAVAEGSNIVLTFSENVFAGSGNIVISNGTDTRTIAVGDLSQVTINGGVVTINPTADLQQGSTYHVQMANGVFNDQAGNAYVGITGSTVLNFETAPGSSANDNIVVFDLVQGVSSDHSGRAFDADTSYVIYIRVNSNSNVLSTAGNGPGDWGTWSGANNLGTDDRIVLVGGGGPVMGSISGPVTYHANLVVNGPNGPGSLVHNGIAWMGSVTVADLHRNGNFIREYSNAPNAVDLWSGTWGVSANPNAEQVGQSAGPDVYLIGMPVGILTSQGLA